MALCGFGTCQWSTVLGTRATAASGASCMSQQQPRELVELLLRGPNQSPESQCEPPQPQTLTFQPVFVETSPMVRTSKLLGKAKPLTPQHAEAHIEKGFM